MQLRQKLPEEKFYATHSPHIKLYIDSLPQKIKEVLDRDAIDMLRVVREKVPQKISKITYMIRHFESNYNSYKKRVEVNPVYQQFLKATTEEEQISLAKVLLKEFSEDVGIDYHTPLSEAGKEQAEIYGKHYGEFFSDPDVAPDKIVVSPYIRTKHTAHSVLKNIQGLDMDIDFLLDTNDLTDMRIGQLHGKSIAIELSDQVRERDFGSLFGPWFIRNLINGDSSRALPLNYLENEKKHYYTSTNGGESQDMVNGRAKSFFLNSMQNNRYKRRLVFTHHLFILAGIRNTVGGSFNTFHNLDQNRRPQNGSLTAFVQLPGGSEMYPSDRIRVAAYNLYPSDDK